MPAPNWIERVSRLANYLSQVPRVQRAARERRGGTVDSKARQIATGLADIDGSAKELFDVLIPALLEADPSSAEADASLNDVGEAYRHILYHILDTKMFDYVVPPLS